VQVRTMGWPLGCGFSSSLRQLAARGADRAWPTSAATGSFRGRAGTRFAQAARGRVPLRFAFVKFVERSHRPRGRADRLQTPEKQPVGDHCRSGCGGTTVAASRNLLSQPVSKRFRHGPAAGVGRRLLEAAPWLQAAGSCLLACSLTLECSSKEGTLVCFAGSGEPAAARFPRRVSCLRTSEGDLSIASEAPMEGVKKMRSS